MLARAREGQQDDRLEVRIADDGHWTWRDANNPRRVGDIFDLARREGASDLKAARDAVAAYDEAMRAPNRRQREAEEKARIEIDGADPDRDLKQAGADADRLRDIGGAEHEDRREAAGQAFARAEAARIQRLNQEAAQARDTEQQLLRHVELQRPGDAYVSEQAQLAADTRMAQSAERARRAAEPEPQPEAPRPPPGPRAPETRAVGIPTPAQLRYTAALAEHYDPRTPIASLARASLAEAAAWQRDRHELDQRVAAEGDPARRDALMLRRDIEHADHMAQAYGRVAQLGRVTGATETPDYEQRVAQYQQQGAGARRMWAERGKEHPDLYPPLNPELARAPEQAQEPRTLEQERAAMKRLDLPEYAAGKHSYEIEWSDPEHSRATLTKGDEELRATKGRDGAWSYESRTSAERGDILDFEINRGAKTAANAREQVRPELERVEQERGRLDPQPERDRGGPDRDAPSPGDDNGPELDPTRRGRGRGR